MSESKNQIHSSSDNDDVDSIPLSCRKMIVSKAPAVQTDDKKRKIVDMDQKKSSKNPFARKFSYHDELVILQGIIDFKAKTGNDYNSNIVAFHKFIEDSLSGSLSARQVISKIKRLKHRFKKYSNKGHNNSAIEDKFYKLAMKIWGNEGQGDSGRKVKVGNVVADTPLEPVGKDEKIFKGKSDDMEVETKHCSSMYPYLCATLESYVLDNFTKPVVCAKEYVQELVSGLRAEKAGELDQGWKEFRAMELKASAKRTKLMTKQAEAVMNAVL